MNNTSNAFKYAFNGCRIAFCVLNNMVDLRIIRRRANAFWRSENLPPIYDIRLFGRVCVCGWGLFSSSNAYTHTPTRTQNTLQKKLDSTCFHTGATPPFDIYNFRHRTILAHTRRACCTHTSSSSSNIYIHIYIYYQPYGLYTPPLPVCVCFLVPREPK